MPQRFSSTGHSMLIVEEVSFRISGTTLNQCALLWCNSLRSPLLIVTLDKTTYHPQQPCHPSLWFSLDKQESGPGKNKCSYDNVQQVLVTHLDWICHLFCLIKVHLNPKTGFIFFNFHLVTLQITHILFQGGYVHPLQCMYGEAKIVTIGCSFSALYLYYTASGRICTLQKILQKEHNVCW